ncbi:HAD-IIA family hydrolase [Brevibacterium casei]|uniref:HAD-superfamily class IIA hydrolase, TIGR01459 n=1 Tax=Brevibacterium casei CIP 102111 TaxID=1255625 RepID=A0A2H1I2R9_9MICO|nr:HAD-IIA family hydrolase [Brevibacterium casei]QPR40801.1 HAD-IIA family hydrolase [Brevibacterium casei]QPR44957.1 HAD-IIA family hydrolase [Brevibacterium casei]SMX69410.1 HAD-superfamily class IIA hydrolase, TIGR01459 [Brevibacterium casei CIP 102111]
MTPGAERARDLGVPAGTPIDGVLFDLDGVVYHGPDAIPGAVEGIAGLHDRGIPVGYVTNNATRTAEVVADHISDLGIRTEPNEVITSSQVLAARLGEEYGTGAKILLIGTTGLSTALTEAGLTIVDSLADEPVALAQGLDPHIDYAGIVRAAEAIATGLDWWATNPDYSMVGRASRVPGNGAFVDMLARLTDRQPRIVGKPSPDVMTHAGQRLGARRPLMVGDRLDTDIEGGNRAGFDTALVLTGVHDLHDALTADPIHRPTFILPTLADLPRVLEAAASRPVGSTAPDSGRKTEAKTQNRPVDHHSPTANGDGGSVQAATMRFPGHSAEENAPKSSADLGAATSKSRGTGGGREIDLAEAELSDPAAIEAALRLAWKAIDAGESIEPGNLPRRIDD